MGSLNLNCEGIARRDFLQLGVGGLLGLGMGDLIGLRASAAKSAGKVMLTTLIAFLSG